MKAVSFAAICGNNLSQSTEYKSCEPKNCANFGRMQHVLTKLYDVACI